MKRMWKKEREEKFMIGGFFVLQDIAFQILVLYRFLMLVDLWNERRIILATETSTNEFGYDDIKKIFIYFKMSLGHICQSVSSRCKWIKRTFFVNDDNQKKLGYMIFFMNGFKVLISGIYGDDNARISLKHHNYLLVGSDNGGYWKCTPNFEENKLEEEIIYKDLATFDDDDDDDKYKYCT